MVSLLVIFIYSDGLIDNVLASMKDYLKSIVYEKKLNKDFVTRRKEKTNKSMKMIDFSIHRRIIALYERMTRRYRHDVVLLKDYLNYLLS